MKEKELREVSTCGICGKKIGACGIPIFYRVRIETHVIDMAAVQRQQGLGMMLGGNGMLAAVMGPDEQMTKQPFKPAELTVCGACVVTETCVSHLQELGEKEAEKNAVYMDLPSAGPVRECGTCGTTAHNREEA